MKKTMIAIALMALTGAAIANSNVPLTGGTVNPHGLLQIKLTPLYEGQYNVSCVVNATPFKANDKPIVRAFAQATNPGPNNASVGIGSTYATGELQAALPKQNATIKFLNVSKGEFGQDYLGIANMDNTAVLNVQSCVATALSQQGAHPFPTA